MARQSSLARPFTKVVTTRRHCQCFPAHLKLSNLMWPVHHSHSIPPSQYPPHVMSQRLAGICSVRTRPIFHSICPNSANPERLPRICPEIRHCAIYRRYIGGAALRAENDPLGSAVAAVLRQWPLSGVLANLPGAPNGDVRFAGHAGLQLLYAERLIEHENAAWMPASGGRWNAWNLCIRSAASRCR